MYILLLNERISKTVSAIENARAYQVRQFNTMQNISGDFEESQHILMGDIS